MAENRLSHLGRTAMAAPCPLLYPYEVVTEEQQQIYKIKQKKISNMINIKKKEEEKELSCVSYSK